MTNKFRRARIYVPCGVDEVSDIHFMRDNRQTVIESLTIAAELQDDADTLKALDDVCDSYDAGKVIGAEILTEAIKARPLFKKLAGLV